MHKTTSIQCIGTTDQTVHTDQTALKLGDNYTRMSYFKEPFKVNFLLIFDDQCKLIVSTRFSLFLTVFNSLSSCIPTSPAKFTSYTSVNLPSRVKTYN